MIMGLKEVLPEIMTEFPEMGRTDIRDLKKGIDGAFKTFVREYGEVIENFFYPLKIFLSWFENLLLGTPWPLMIVVFAVLVWLSKKSWACW